MPDIVKIMEIIIPYIAISLVVIMIIVVHIIRVNHDKSIVKLYMEGKYDEASKKLNSSRVIAIGAYKQWHNYYDALILIANEEYLEAEEILNNIKLRKTTTKSRDCFGYATLILTWVNLMKLITIMSY